MRIRSWRLPALLCIAVLATGPALAAQRLLEKSIVTLPKTAQGFAFESADFDPAQPLGGVIARFGKPDLPKDVAFRVHVMPVGRGAEADAVALIAKSFQADMAKVPQYEGVKPGQPQRTTVDGRASFLVAPGASNVPPLPSSGIVQSFTFTFNGEPQTMAATTFYRHLFGIRVTVLGPSAAMDVQKYGHLVLSAANAIVPQIDIRNFGACGDISVPPNTPDAPGAMVEKIKAARRDNCSTSEQKQAVPPPAGGMIYTLAYPEPKGGK